MQLSTGNAGTIFTVAFGAGGSAMLASGGADRLVRLWRVGRRAIIGHPVAGSGGAVYGLAFSPAVAARQSG